MNDLPHVVNLFGCEIRWSTDCRRGAVYHEGRLVKEFSQRSGKPNCNHDAMKFAASYDPAQDAPKQDSEV